VWIGSSGIALAALTETPDPIAIGTVTVGQSGTASGTLSANGGGVTIDRFDLTAPGCSEFQVTTPTPLVVGSGGGAKAVTVQLSPTSTGAKSCSIDALDSASAVLATFTATGTAVAPAVISVSASSLSFGSVRVAAAAVTTATKTLTLSNAGNAGSTLIISTITFSDPDYSLQPAPSFPITIAAGSNQAVTVEFDPSAAGAHGATLAIASNDPVTPTKSVGLTGTGTTALIAAGDVNFGTVNDGATGSQNVAVTNSSTSSPGLLTVTSATITGGSFFSFGTTQGCSGGTTCTFTQPFTVTTGTLNVPVRCQPPAAAAGTQTATVTFVSDSDPGGDTTAQLTCTAGRPNILVSANTLAFSNVAVGSTSPAQTVTIMNTGNATLTYSLAKTPNAAQYAISGCTGGCTVAAGGMATFSVTFSPTAIGALSIRIDITNNDPDPGDSPFPIDVSGTGTAPQINVAPASLTFANTEVGRTSGAQTVTATNSGNTPLTISSATFSTGAGDYTIVTGQSGLQTIAPSTSASWDIACRPSAQGPRAGKFRIVSDSLTGSPTDVALTCTGEQGIVTTIPTSLDFGPVAQGTTKQLTFTLKNTGNVPISGITGALDNTTIGYQFDPATVPATLAAGASKSLTVTFAPQSGNDGGPATITFNASWGSFGSTTTATLTLNGDGLSTSYDVSPMALDFMDFRFDTAPQLVYHIINSGQADVAILTQTFTPDPGTASTEFGFTIKRGTTTVVLPQTLAAGQQLDVTVTAQPNNRIGLVSGHVDLHSNLGMTPDRRVTLTGNATTAGIAVVPATMVVDFGAVDIDGPPPTKTIMLTNNGAAILDVNSILKSVGASPAFTVTLPTVVTHVAPGTTLALQVTYTPTVDRPPNQPETMVLTANLAGILAGPGQAMIMVQGYGIDRHLGVAAVQDFPPTFRNPGDMAPIQAINVRNTGLATLHIAGVMVTGDPVWQLVDGAAIDLPGGASHDFQVKFAPTTVGAAPTGQLTITNNDNARPMAMVTLNGVGLSRMVAFGPETGVNLGFTGIGIPITATDILAVTNLDHATSFKIHAITLTDDTMFRVDNAPADLVLPTSEAHSFGITFDPTTEGHFETTARLYLDQDGEEQATVKITGDAVFVDAHGSGGCDAGGAGAGGGSALAFGVLTAFGSLVRRRRRARVAIAAGALAATVAIAPAAHADGIDLAVFEPTPATSSTGFQLQSPEVGADGSWVASSILSYASNPLVLEARDTKGQFISRDALIERSSLLQLGGAYAFLDRFEAGAHLPLYMQSGEAQKDPTLGFSRPPASGTAVGNLTLHAKGRLWRGGGGIGTLVAGASVVVVVPTATKDQFTGSDKPAARALLLGSFTPAALLSRLMISGNAGAIVRGKTVYANIAQQSGVAWGAGASFRVLDELWATAELFGEATPSGKRQPAGAMPSASVLSPVEWLAGASYKMDPRFTIGLAVGRGVTNGLGTPDVRGVLSLAFVQGAPALAPIHPPEVPKPDGDADGDGIPDSIDKCPNEPEDKDMFDDADGCPDPDNDHDGILDAQDKCPNEAEDKDGFQDDDGCPELDNDQDGINDLDDRCPNEPEDMNGLEDDDGCPDEGSYDKDGDGIAETRPGDQRRALPRWE
jgi:uncharacterized protein (TIGR03382 family)